VKPIEEKVADAIAELESLLTTGQSPEIAVPNAAEIEGLKPEVLQFRAEKVLGDLRTFKSRSDAQYAQRRQKRLEQASVYEFAEMDKVYKDFSNWFEGKTGRLPTSDEIKEMERLSMEAILKKLLSEA
jgi:hypothetical protein